MLLEVFNYYMFVSGSACIIALKYLGDHLRQSGPSVAATLDPVRPATATKIVVDGLGGSLTAWDQLRYDKSHAFNRVVRYSLARTMMFIQFY